MTAQACRDCAGRRAGVDSAFRLRPASLTRTEPRADPDLSEPDFPAEPATCRPAGLIDRPENFFRQAAKPLDITPAPGYPISTVEEMVPDHHRPAEPGHEGETKCLATR